MSSNGIGAKNHEGDMVHLLESHFRRMFGITFVEHGCAVSQVPSDLNPSRRDVNTALGKMLGRGWRVNRLQIPGSGERFLFSLNTATILELPLSTKYWDISEHCSTILSQLTAQGWYVDCRKEGKLYLRDLGLAD